MSADNGIYILKTPKGNSFEFRVKELQAVENVDWDYANNSYTIDDDIRIINAREMWADCQIFYDEQIALDEARRLYDLSLDDFGFEPEDGIQIITILREF